MHNLCRAAALWGGLLVCFPAFGAPINSAVDDIAAQFVGDSTPGLGVLVMRKGQVVHMSGYGFADIARGDPITQQSIFDLASVSKQMTALVARMQMDDGLYAPQTPIIQILPQLADMDGAEEITVAHLIYHLSGLPDYLDWGAYSSQKSNQDVLKWLSRQEVQEDSGAVFDYSNTGYLVLGSLIAAAEGKRDLASVLQSRIWGPQGMLDTSLPRASDPSRRVTGYAGQDGDFARNAFPDNAQGDGNVHSSLQDMARYEAGFWNGSYLRDLRILFESGRDRDGSPIFDDGAGYGYGWAVSKDGEYADHSGGWAGTSTYYLRNLRTGVAVILLANGEDAELSDLAVDIEAALP